MANCHNLFQSFNQVIKLTESRRHALLLARNNLRDRMGSSFENQKNKLPSVHQLSFQTQGSFVMDTIINPISEDYDLDDGVYFMGDLNRNQRPPTKLFHNFVEASVSSGNEAVQDVIDKDTCVRVRYKEGFRYLFENKSTNLKFGFHVDLPIYYSTTKRSPDLAHLKKSWITSDPIEFIQWFEDIVKSNFRAEYLYERKLFSVKYDQWRDQMRKEDAQLRRIVRYLKAWCDNKGKDMPCGIILTILAAENYQANERDDECLKDVLVKIKENLDKEFICKRPTTPKGDNLFEGYEHEEMFKRMLSLFVESAKQAINESNQKVSCAKWQSHFGNRFSCSGAIDQTTTGYKHSSPAIITSNAKSAGKSYD